MLNHDEAEHLLKQLELMFDGDVSLFDEEGDLIVTNNRKAINRKNNEIALNVRMNGEIKSVTDKGLYFPLYEGKDFICTVYLNTKSGILKIIPELTLDYLTLLNNGQDKDPSVSFPQESLRQLGIDLIGELKPEKVEQCRQNAKLVNVDLRIPRFVIMFDFGKCLGNKMERIDNNQIADFTNSLYSKISKVLGNNIFFHYYEMKYILLYEVKQNELIDLEELYSQIASLVPSAPKMALGNLCTQIMEYHTSFTIAEETLKIGKQYDPDKQIYDWSNYRTAILLLNSNNETRQVMLDTCKEVIAYFKENREMTATILSFFENGMNITKTGEQMHYHRNTILYRMNKFTEDTNIDIFNAKYCAEVYNLIRLSQANL